MSVPDDPTTIVKDEGTIVAAWTADGQTGASVGMSGVTQIKAVEEPGQMAMVPWLLVYKGDFLYQRLNAAHLLTVEYAPGG